jgi:hypothetical protein
VYGYSGEAPEVAACPRRISAGATSAPSCSTVTCYTFWIKPTTASAVLRHDSSFTDAPRCTSITRCPNVQCWIWPSTAKISSSLHSGGELTLARSARLLRADTCIDPALRRRREAATQPHKLLVRQLHPGQVVRLFAPTCTCWNRNTAVYQITGCSTPAPIPPGRSLLPSARPRPLRLHHRRRTHSREVLLASANNIYSAPFVLGALRFPRRAGCMGFELDFSPKRPE